MASSKSGSAGENQLADVAGKARPTILDIARIAQVAPSTVSNALSGLRHVEEHTARRVREAAIALGYTPSPLARRLRTGRTNAIGLLSSMPFGVAGGSSRLGFMMELAAAAAATALERGLALTLLPPVQAGGPPIADLLLDGALIIEPCEDDPFVQAIRDRGLPHVAIGKQPGVAGDMHVDLRSRDVAELLIDHLEQTGAKRIALLTGETRRTSYLETEAAFAARMRALGREPIALRADEAGGEEAGYSATARLLKQRPDTDAVIALVDAFASGACKAARETGRSIPGDLRIVTRYDGPRARENDPPLTAVGLGLAEVARSAVSLLIDAIEQRKPQRLSLPAPSPKLVVRASSAPPDA